MPQRSWYASTLWLAKVQKRSVTSSSLTSPTTRLCQLSA